MGDLFFPDARLAAGIPGPRFQHSNSRQEQTFSGCSGLLVAPKGQSKYLVKERFYTRVTVLGPLIPHTNGWPLVSLQGAA